MPDDNYGVSCHFAGDLDLEVAMEQPAARAAKG
jgi:hypothetical protein